MRSICSLFCRIIITVLILLSLLGTASCGTKVAAFTPLTVLSFVRGNVVIQKLGTSNWIDGKEGMTLEAGYKVKTDDGATATVTFFDGSIIELNSSTEISLDQLLGKSSTSPKTIRIGQAIGETSSSIVKLVDPASRYEIDTQAGVAAVGGSKMVVTVAIDGTTQVYNVEGTISFTAQGQVILIPTGSVSSAKPGEIPSTPQPGTPPAIDAPAVTSISSTMGWQLTSLYLNAGDKFYVNYRGGSWTVAYKNFPYVGPSGYSVDIDKTIAAGYKFDSSVPYAYLLGKVGNGNLIYIGNKGGQFTADVSGLLSLRINDSDDTLGDDDGAITVNPVALATETTVTNVKTTTTVNLATTQTSTATIISSATVIPITGTPTSTGTTPTTTFTTIQTSTPLTQVNVWLTTTNDSTAAPVSTLIVGSATTLYIWAQGGNGQTGDFTLYGILQNGTQMQLGSTKHATQGNVIYCGQWNGGFLNTVGSVTVNATSGGTTVGSTTINITN